VTVSISASALSGWWLELTALSELALAVETSAKSRVDVECDVDAEGIPGMNGRRLQAMLREAMAPLPDAADHPELLAELVGAAGRLEQSRLAFGRLQPHPDCLAQLRLALHERTSPLAPNLLLEAFTVERAMAARDRARFGAPRTGALRRVRLLREGTRLYARLYGWEAMNPMHWRLLAGGCLNLRHLGLRRNRGWGHVTLRLLHDGVDSTEARFEGRGPAPVTSAGAGPPPPAAVTPEDSAAGGLDDPSHRFVHFLLHLTQPVVASAPGGDANSVPTHDHLPGSLMRGAIAALPRVRADPALLERLILSGQVRFLPARPAEWRDGWRRSLPIPRSWWRIQGTDELVDLACDSADAGEPTPAGGEGEEGARVRPDAAYVCGLNGPTAVRVWTTATLHLQRGSPRHGRATADAGAIFTYESIDAGQDFVWSAEVQDLQVASDLEQLLTGEGAATLRLGRSAAANYGGFPEVTRLASTAREVEWLDLPKAPVAAGRKLWVLLTSDALVRHPETGEFDPREVPAAIARASGGRLRELPRGRFLADRLRSGINRRGGTALGRELAAAAGSLMTFETTEALSPEDVVALETRGVGERRLDGCGSLLILTQEDLGGHRLRLGDAPASRSATVTPLAPAGEELQAVLVRLARDRRVARCAERIAATASRLPSRSTLERVRAAVRRHGGDATSLRQWLGRLAPPARRALLECRLHARREPIRLLCLLDALATGLGVPDGVFGEPGEWQFLGEALVAVESEKARTWLGTDEARMALALPLIEELCRRGRR
jgi:CRISPR-associated protein Csx10